VEVRRVSRNPHGGYVVHYRSHDAQGGAFEASVGADIVILSAGTLGSTEILLRSREAGLPVSDRVGYGFTGNGDVLGFGYNCDDRIHGIGAGDRATKPLTSSSSADAVGPCITSVIDLRATDDVNDGMIIEEGSLPGPIAKLLPGPLGLADDAFGVSSPHGIGDGLRKKWRKLVSLFAGPYHGAMQSTQTYLVMTHERTAGRMELVNDRVRVSWPGIGEEPVFEAVNRRLIEATNALGGTFVRNPLWTDLFKHHLLTVHPLGGCVMADSAASGAVNHKGQVFSGTTGSEVHDGLYVSDGSVIPRSLGCNPLLTISAVTERACALIAADRGWTIDYALPSRPPLRIARDRAPTVQEYRRPAASR
jgi:cholesterol oxidase